MEKKWDIVVIGAGPGGYIAAIRGAQLGKRVLLVEKNKVGGVCMNWGCIPTKFLLHQTSLIKNIKSNANINGPVADISLNWEKVQDEKERAVERLVQGIEFLLNKNKIELIKGTASISSENVILIKTGEKEEMVEAEKIILATGSRPAFLPFLKPDGKFVLTSRDALGLKAIPKKLLVVGAGAIGLEMGVIYHRMGCEVEVLEIMPQILPGIDRDIALRIERSLKSQGIRINTRMSIKKSVLTEKSIKISGTCLKTEQDFEIETDRVLLAAGRKPNSEELVKDCPDLLADEKGFIRVNEKLETGVPRIYAIGDLIGGKLLAHKASHEGILAAENASGLNKRISYHALPYSVFIEPEYASVGINKTEAKEKQIEIKTGMFTLQASGRALTMGAQEGIVQIIADKEDKIIGANVLAPNASELISELTLAIHTGLKLKDVGGSIHIHPTLSESIMEAALKADNQAIHTLND
jgi:dihydrolipoamide dehydrogenase